MLRGGCGREPRFPSPKMKAAVQAQTQQRPGFERGGALLQLRSNPEGTAWRAQAFRHLRSRPFALGSLGDSWFLPELFMGQDFRFLDSWIAVTIHRPPSFFAGQL